MDFAHESVLLKEATDLLNINSSGTYVDCTAGGGGHSAEIHSRLQNGRLILIDQDPDAIEVLKKKFSNYKNAIIIKSNFSQTKEVLAELNVNEIDGALLDIGVSSYQLDNEKRGFSYHKDAKLDMRMSKTGLSAYDVVNEYSVQDLIRIFKNYGEERFSKRIAFAIAEARENKPIQTTLALVAAIKSAVPAAAMREFHPAKRVFQAVRIEVNNELSNLQSAINNIFSILKPGGNIAIVTFHSLEDRIVKKQMASWCQGCICPPDFPVCVCKRQPEAKLLTKKPILPSAKELANNPRSRSAKLRGITKLPASCVF